jgi:DNA-directed RNA polymerase specialized sigma24 family protein
LIRPLNYCSEKYCILEKTITKDILKNELYSGEKPAVELLYSRYGAMLYSYLLQFVPDKGEAEELLVDIFSRLGGRLQEACDSNLSIYCWLQVEARKLILEYTQKERKRAEGPDKAYYFLLLEEASPEHQWVFREIWLYGRKKEELALQLNKDPAYIADLLRECLLIIRKKLG